MEAQRFDAATRAVGAGASRRSVLGALIRGAVGAPLTLLLGSHAAAQPGCRQEGHPCEGNQTCCPGLICVASGPGAANRCTAACEVDCPAAVAQVAVDIQVEADCAFAADVGQTTCTFTAAAGELEVASIAVPEAELCAEVLGGDYEETELGANARSKGKGKEKGKAKGLRSKKSKDGPPVVTLVLKGEVATAATAVYWCETGEAVLVPAAGPGLACGQAEASPTSEVSDSTGAILVQIYACDVSADVANVEWFEICDAPTAAATFRLSEQEGDTWAEVETQQTDAEGLCRFGQLRPGTYRLEQTDGAWCHAESDSVDDQGNVVVKAGARATVWAFYCAEAK